VFGKLTTFVEVQKLIADTMVLNKETDLFTFQPVLQLYNIWVETFKIYCNLYV